MPAHLKSLELHGYKTFANRTVFEFSDSITAIVGPNGSGKSNIADSLRWVLGEQSYSLLRGKKTEDMIFSGSELRSRAGMASATVTFDNSEGWLPIDFSEVAITRRAYRDGENEYLINGQRMRLRDVHELLGNSGLGERTYTIIGQGLVDAVLSLKAEERRRLFEEAAGIGLHRGRREEALRRLDTTRRNLDRVRDILAELQPRLSSLERQARRAQEYNQVKSDLRVVLHDWYGYHWHRSLQELAEARRVARLQDSTLESTRQEQMILDGKLKVIRARTQEIRHELNGWHHQLSQLHTQREQFNLDLAVTEERLHSLDLQAQDLAAGQVQMEEDAALQQERLMNLSVEQSRLEAELAEAKSQFDISRKELFIAQTARASAEDELRQLNQRLQDANVTVSQLQGGVKESEAQLHRDQQALVVTQKEITDLEKELVAVDLAYQARLSELNQADIRLQAEDQEFQEFQQLLASLESQLRLELNERSSAAAALASLNAELSVLQQAEATLSGYAGGTRLLLQAGRDKKIRGIRSTLVKDLTIPMEYEVAIGAILGDTIQAVILDEDVDSALDLLLNQSARGVVIPLNAIIPPEQVNLVHQSLEKDPEVIGRAVDLVEAPEDLRAAVELLLGQAIIVRDRPAARRLIEKLGKGRAIRNANLRLATLDGQVFHPGGPILVSGAKSGEGTQSILGRQRRNRELLSIIEDTRQHFEELTDRLDQLQGEVAKANQTKDRLADNMQSRRSEQRQAALAVDKSRLTLEQAQRQLAWHQAREENLRAEISQREAQRAQMHRDLTSLQHELQRYQALSREQSARLMLLSTDEAQEKVTHWNTAVVLSQRMLNEAQQRSIDSQENMQRLARQQKEAELRLESIASTRQSLTVNIQATQAEFHRVGEQIAALQSLIDPAEATLNTIDAEQEQVQAAEAAARQALNLAEHHSAQARIAQTRCLEALQSLRGRIEEDFGLVAFEYDEQVSGANPLPLEGMVDRLPVVEQLAPDVEESLRRLQTQLRRIGPINPEAQEEYEEVQRRFGFLTEQVADLEKAEVDVRQVIKELDTLMELEFNSTFLAVAEEFKTIFSRLFGGGTARLYLSDPEDLTSTGIEIEARLPGRRTQGLVLLSGGERSLTAAALIFALLKISPTPFCLLDEVDAMLDEANVGRFRDLLRELSQRTQFIIVTHNRNTVQAADVIYGITMGRDSSSQVLSLKLDEVADIVD
jgi:chromosome segregation protein